MKKVSAVFWYWREVRTGCIYQYEFGVKPYGADGGAWVRASVYQYYQQFEPR